MSFAPSSTGSPPNRPKPVQTKPSTNPNDNPVPGTPEYQAKYGSNGKGYTVGGVQYDSSGNPIRTSQVPNTPANRNALDQAGVKYNQGGASLFTNAGELEGAIRGENPSVMGYASTAKPEEPSTSLFSTTGKNSQENPEISNTSVNFAETQNKKTTDVSFTPKSSKSLSDSVFSSKPSPKNTSGVKNSFFIDSSYGQAAKGQNIRNTQGEQATLLFEATRASSKVANESNADYITGGTPSKRSQGGVETPQSVFLESKTNYGQRGNNQNIRNSQAENLLLVSEANRALQKENTENVSFTTFTTPKPKPNEEKVQEFNNQELGIALSSLSAKEQNSKALGQGLTNLSNNQKAAQQEKEFNDYLTTNANKGATIQILEGDRILGTFQGPKAISGVQAFEKSHPNESFSILASYPEREQALTEAVKSNPSPFLNQPQSFWNQASKNGYLSQNNIGKIQNSLYLESAIENRESLGSFQSQSSVFLYKSSENGEVASFLRIPFSGNPQYNSIIGSFGLPIRAQNRTSTSELPSTSLSNLLIFTPTFGNSGIKLGTEILEDLVGQGAKVAAKAPKFKLTDLGEAVNSVKNPVVRKVVSPFISSPKLEDLPKSSEIQVRNRATFRNTNPTRTKLPSDIISNDNSNGLTPFSETPKPLLPVNSDNLRNAAKAKIQQSEQNQNQKEFGAIQNNLLVPTKAVSNNPPASPNIPFFTGRINAQGKQLTGNKAPLSISNTSSNEAANISGKTFSISPINTVTEQNTGLSLTSRQSFEPQFIGVYPTSYLPPAPVFEAQEQPDIYSNAGIGIFDASTFRNNAPTNYKEFEIKQKAKKVAEADKTFGFLVKSKPLVPIRVKNAIGQYYKESSPFDFVQQPRSERVENRVFYEYPLSATGKRLSISEAAQEGPLFGALRPISAKQEIENQSQGPKPLTRSSDMIGKYAIGGKAPLNIYSVKFTQPVNAKELFGLAGEKVEKGSGKGKYSGLLPLEKYGLISQPGKREGEIYDINKETGLAIREYSSKDILSFGPKTSSSPIDIFSRGSTTSNGKIVADFLKPTGQKYYTSSPIYEYGNTFPRGTLQNKDVGLIKFEKFQASQPIDESKLGDKRFNQDVLRFKQSFSKAGIFTPVNPKSKGLGFKSTSAKVIDFEKPKENKKEDFGFKSNTSSAKSETLLVTKKPLKRNPITETTLTSDYEYDFVKNQPSRESAVLITSQKSDILSGLKFGPIISQKQKGGSILDNLSKNSLGLKEFNINITGSKQNQTPKQKPGQGLTPKQIPRILQTPKQSTKPKQSQNNPTPLVPRSNQTQSPKFLPIRPFSPTLIPQYPPPKTPTELNFGGFKIRGKNYKAKSGPSGLEELGVKNIFTSSFDIKVTKQNRFEF